MSKGPAVRAGSTDDLDEVRRIVTNAYGGERTAELLDALRDSVAWLDLVFLAEHQDEVVAAACCTRAWLDAPTRLVEVLVLMPVVVLPDRQRVGTGSLLVKQSLELLKDRPEPLVFLEGDPGFFSRLGFVAGEELGFSPPSARIPGPAFQVATLHGYDQQEMAGAVVYPDAWWRQDAVGQRRQI